MRDTRDSREFQDMVDSIHVIDDFAWYISPHLWTAVLTDSGTVTIDTTKPGGVILIHPSDGTVADNDESYLAHTNALFTVTAGLPIKFDARILFAEAATDDANLIIGLSSTSAANTLQDDGAGPPANYSGVVFFKVDGQTYWQCEVSNGTTQQTFALTANSRLVGPSDMTAGSTAYQRLSFEINPKTSTTADIVWCIDGQPVAEVKDWVYTSISAMKAIVGIKNGGSTEDLLYVDYVYVTQVRDR